MRHWLLDVGKRWNGGTSHADPITASTPASFLSLRLVSARRMPWLCWAIQGPYSKARSLLSLGSRLVSGVFPATKKNWPVEFVLVFVFVFFFFLLKKKTLSVRVIFLLSFVRVSEHTLLDMVTHSRKVPAMWDNTHFALAPASWYPLLSSPLLRVLPLAL